MFACERETSNGFQSNTVWVGTAWIAFIMCLAAIGLIIIGTFLKTFSSDPEQKQKNPPKDSTADTIP